MTTEQLKERVSVSWRGHGTYKVTITYRGHQYSSYTHNSMAYDRVKDGGNLVDTVTAYGYTMKEALRSLWDECKYKNDIDKIRANVW